MLPFSVYDNKIVFLIIEVEGGGNVKKIFPDATKIFIMPPSMEELESRLRGRNTDSEEAILSRLRIAKQELQRAEEYDYIVENDNLDKAIECAKMPECTKNSSYYRGAMWASTPAITKNQLF